VAALLVGCSVTTVAFDRQSERPAAAVKLAGAEIAVYTSAAPPSAEYMVVGSVTALKGMEQLQGLTSPGLIGLTADGKLLYGVDRDAPAAVAIDPESGKVVATVPVGQKPFGLAVRPVGR